MKILLIEDEDRGVRHAKASIARILGDVDVHVARNLEQAKTAIASGGFDLAICDIRIGSDPDSLDANESHGLAAYAELNAHSPGTPAVFLSAFASVENTSDRASSGGVADVFGISNFALTQVVPKGNPSRIETYLEQIRDGLQNLDSCVVEGAHDLGEMFVRAIQVYALSIDSKYAHVTPMSGLSGARVGLIRYSLEAQSDVVVVLKLDSHHLSALELEKYDTYVAPRLTVGTFAPQIRILRAGLRGMTAVVSSVASPSSESLFARLGAKDGEIDVSSVRSTLSGWSFVGKRTMTTLGEYRASVIDEDVFLSLPSYSCDLSSLDSLQIEISWKISHGDLHGDNILIDNQGHAVLIDFADCATLPAGVDAAALELSLFAHPKSPIDSIWPSVEFDDWADLEMFVANSPWSDLIRNIRRWSYSESNEMQALVIYYAQACWLMKHGGPGADRMKAIALSILTRMQEVIVIE